MPPVKPSDKSSSDGEWWRKDRSASETGDVDPNYARDIDEAELNDTAFDESQLPVQYPT